MSHNLKLTIMVVLAVLNLMATGARSAAQDGVSDAPVYTREYINIGRSHLAAPAGPRGGVGGLMIIPTFDKSITDDPRAADMMAAINSALATYSATFSNTVTVKITFKNTKTGLGSSQTQTTTVSYADYRAALMAQNNTGVIDTKALTRVPDTTNNPVDNKPDLSLKTAHARALGFDADPPNGQPDSTVGLKMSIINIAPGDTDPDKYSLFAVLCHEVNEVLGSGSGIYHGKPGPAEPEDLFRYDYNGNRSYTADADAAAYFTLDGTTLLAQFNQDKDGDYGDWYSVNGGVTPQVQDAFSTPGKFPKQVVEYIMLDALGWTRKDGALVNAPPMVISDAMAIPDPIITSVPATFMLAATDLNGDELTVAWDFGDESTGNGQTCEHVYTHAGVYGVTVTILDGFGGETNSSVTVTVVNGIFPAAAGKKSFLLNFKFPSGKDHMDVTLTSEKFKVAAEDPTVRFIIGDVSTNMGTVVGAGTLSKGKATGDVGKFTLNSKKGTLRYVTTKGQLQSLLAPFGATNMDTTAPVMIPVYLFYNGGNHGGTLTFNYVGKMGKTGTGR